MKIILSKSGARARRHSAFSFIEVMVAVGIIGVSFAAVFASMTMGFSVTQLSRENLRATQIMLDKMEGVRLYSWSQLNDSTFLISSFTNWFYETNNIGQSNAIGNGVQYTGSVAVAAFPVTNSYSANMRMITVTVNWTSGNVARTRSMVTYSSLSGLQNYVYND